MGLCLSLCGKLRLLFDRRGGAELEKLEIQLASVSPTPRPQPSTGLPQTQTTQSNVDEENDGEFADWEESAPLTISVVSNSGSSSAPTSARTFTKSQTAEAAEPTPPPQPEPDFFGNMGMGVTSSSIQVTRVAAKKPLPSTIAQPVTYSNSTSSRFTEDLVDEPPIGGGKAAAPSWGDDLDSLVPTEPIAKKKKPRGLGAVAVAIED